VDEVTAQLRLEWLGARDRPLVDTDRLSHRDLLTVIARSAVFDAATSRDADGVAALTGWTRDHVVRRRNRGQLWSYNAGEGERFPAWQFVRENPSWKVRPLPGLAPLIDVIPPDAPPLLVRKVMTTEDAALLVKGSKPLSPVNWLATNHSPWPVVQVAYRYFHGATDLMQGLLLQYEHEGASRPTSTRRKGVQPSEPGRSTPSQGKDGHSSARASSSR
jgi:hypothetical protein